MTRPALVIFATCYDDVTRRMLRVAKRLLSGAEQLGIAAFALFEAEATSQGVLGAVAERPTVLAMYSHGDIGGTILDQGQEPCWANGAVPDLSGIALFAHACRGIRWLGFHAPRHKARLLVGYEDDIYSPPDGSDWFWDTYEEVHSFIPRNLAAGADHAQVREEFYALCTNRIGELDRRQASLIELVALVQSRDRIIFVSPP